MNRLMLGLCVALCAAANAFAGPFTYSYNKSAARYELKETVSEGTAWVLRVTVANNEATIASVVTLGSVSKWLVPRPEAGFGVILR